MRVSELFPMAAGVIGTAQYAAPELMDGCDEAEEGLAAESQVQVETILKSDVYRSDCAATSALSLPPLPHLCRLHIPRTAVSEANVNK